MEASDAERPLTAKGKSRMRRGAKSLRVLVPQIDLLATSPLVRAQETAEIISEVYGDLEIVETSSLAPGEPPEAFAQWLGSQTPPGDTVAIVGHEPGLSLLTSWLLAGATRSIVELKKGGAVLLDCPGGPTPAAATLLWSLRPGHLRALRT